MIGTIARRAMLRSALAAGASLLVGQSVMSAANAGRTRRAGVAVEPRLFDHDAETLRKYAGEFGGSAKQPSNKGGSSNGRL